MPAENEARLFQYVSIDAKTEEKIGEFELPYSPEQMAESFANSEKMGQRLMPFEDYAAKYGVEKLQFIGQRAVLVTEAESSKG